jgi:hypothetical protein
MRQYTVMQTVFKKIQKEAQCRLHMRNVPNEPRFLAESDPLSETKNGPHAGQQE